MTPGPETFFFKKSRFETYLPMHYRYARSHFWAERREANRLRLGFTRFATHLLGEIVDYNFETPPQTPVRPGQILGWVEGFKAISDIICIGKCGSIIFRLIRCNGLGPIFNRGISKNS